MAEPAKSVDIFVIGGGINGCGIARDASGRGYSVALAEMNDLASATSSASTKLFHGGLRYLEYFEFRLVREALQERETLLKAMPHISWPMRFVLPYHKEMRFEAETPASRLLSFFMPWAKGRRPAWMIRFGLFLYDTLGGREILPGTKSLDLQADPAGKVLQDRFSKAFEYSDCWVDDARLVALNAADAKARGADIQTRTKVVSAEVVDSEWLVTVQPVAGDSYVVQAKMVINAGGPWAGQLLKGPLPVRTNDSIRLVRGSHIVVPRIFEHDRAYFLQGEDGRIIFAIPYEDDFTLIGTTDADHDDADARPFCTEEEISYLCEFASSYFNKPVEPKDVVWTYSGVRPLYDDGASSATAATRDYVLKVTKDAGAPVLNVFGGKITTYRRLAQDAVEKIGDTLGAKGNEWTAGVSLSGGDFAVSDKANLALQLQSKYSFVSEAWATRLIRQYGTNAAIILGDAKSANDLGQDFGATLTEAEVRWLMANEFAMRAEDVVWRRTKLGLRMTSEQISVLDTWMASQ